MHVGRTFKSVVMTALIVGTGFGQQTENTDPASQSLKVDVQLVQLPVAVIDRDGRTVGGLNKENFDVFEDGVQQDITFFKQEDIPVSVGLAIDNSASMHNKRQRVNAAALAFARESNPEDETFVVDFDDQVFLQQDFTSNIDDLIKAFASIDTRGQTAVYDAISLSVDHLRQGKKDKKALLLITDGEDNSSQYSFEKAIDTLHKSDVILYAIGLLDETEERGGFFRKAPLSKAKETLTRFARATGGQAYFPRSIDEIDHLCRSIAHDLRNQYMIGYSPSNPANDGSWRRITVKLRTASASKFTVRAKPGYYAPQAPSQTDVR
jgi:Ca-activated chloride channel homolog